MVDGARASVVAPATSNLGSGSTTAAVIGAFCGRFNPVAKLFTLSTGSPPETIVGSAASSGSPPSNLIAAPASIAQPESAGASRWDSNPKSNVSPSAAIAKESPDAASFVSVPDS